MLGRIDKLELEKMQNIIAQKWGSECKIEAVDIINVPVPMFDLHFVLYDTVKVVICFDRGIIDVFIKQDDEKIYLGELTDKPFAEDFDALEPEKFAHIMDVLDEVARNLSGNGTGNS